ncbi:TonB-dependent receptor plug domain-containing protein [Massilia sp. B-10]|nr:TonB-dependent receptor plug domain-containing protein [Massilia sp. B-10]
MSATPTAIPLSRYRKIAFALALGLPVHGVVRAAPQDLTTVPLEQLLTMEVFSASKFKQNASDAPAVVTVISAADIRAYGWRTLADVARSVRGLYVSYDRNYSYLGERGFLRPGDYNTRFLLLVDGNRVNDAVYDQAPVGGEFPPRPGTGGADRVRARAGILGARFRTPFRRHQRDHQERRRAAGRRAFAEA